MQTIQPNEAVKKILKKTSEIAEYLWQREWAERNGGNISINLTETLGELPADMSEFTFVSQEKVEKDAAGMSFFVTGTGRRMRDLKNPEKAACIIHYNQDASGYYIIWGGDNNPDFRPSSELLPHITMHLELVASGSPYRTVLHTHPIELIALSHHPVIGTDEKFLNHAIWGMLPEVKLYAPQGIGLLPYITPGSIELARATATILKTRDVAIWGLHGATAAGLDAEMAFDFIDVLNKGAKIYLQCRASGFTPVGMTEEQIEELATLL